jgi:hypothetical protein
MSINQICKKCGGHDTYWREEHADTGMDEHVLVCRDCEGKPAPLPLSFRLREKAQIRFGKVWGKEVVSRLFRLARWAAKQGHGRCTWCGAEPGFSSVYAGGKGLRCSSSKRDCSRA